MIDYSLRPILVFWETTKACKLICKHCRAEAIEKPLPDELNTEEAFRLVKMIKEFGKPYPVLILTGGDPLMRTDIFEVIKYAVSNNIPVGIAPTVTDFLHKSLDDIEKSGIKYISISLDGASPNIHDYIRGVEGHFKQTIEILKEVSTRGFKTQVNTLVSKLTVDDLPYIVKLLSELHIRIWEVFFLIKVGRGGEVEDLSPQEYEDVCHFLFEVTRYGIEVRTVEAPFYRRIVLTRIKDEYDLDDIDVKYVMNKYRLGPLYNRLVCNLIKIMGKPPSKPSGRISYTRDGMGVIFVAYNGEVYPSGFAPYKLGNLREADLVSIYRKNYILNMIREARFKGKCGYCEFRNICGGSRARAYTLKGDILSSDPACIYYPKSIKLSKK